MLGLISIDPSNPLLHPTVIVAEVTLISAVLVAVITTVGQVVQKNRVAELGKKADKIVDQVVNSHSTNLRDDLDELRDLMSDGFNRLLDELQLERRERMALGDRLQRHLDQGEKTP